MVVVKRGTSGKRGDGVMCMCGDRQRPAMMRGGSEKRVKILFHIYTHRGGQEQEELSYIFEKSRNKEQGRIQM